MNWRSLVAVLAMLPMASRLSAQQGKRCVLVLDDSVKREFYQSEPVPGNINVFAGGDVRLSCRGENLHLGGDSLTSLNGSVFILITKAYFRDATVSLTSDTITYFKNGEQMQARGHVIVRNLKTGSTLTGPAVDYLRAVKDVRDSAETRAFQRPTLRYLPARGPKDTTIATPYLIVADRLNSFGGSRLFGFGNVVVDRDSLHGTGDSLVYLSGRGGAASLFGKPAQLRRTSHDSFQVRGKEVRLGLDDEVLRDVRAFGDGEVVNGSSEIKGQSVVLAFTDEKLSRTLAWDKVKAATVHNEGYDIKGDSIAIDSPGEKLRELRVFRRGMVQNPVDTAAARVAASDTTNKTPRDRDRLTGERIVASFAQVDSAGIEKTRLHRIEAIGSATSLFSKNVTKDGKTTPSVNYTRADTILVVMKGGDSTGVSSVRAHGTVDGMQLEKASLRKPRSDTSKVALPGKRP
ncbi:MAG: hypothetical protein ABIZ70_07115 [Gemmatimonadales bacterium]